MPRCGPRTCTTAPRRALRASWNSTTGVADTDDPNLDPLIVPLALSTAEKAALVAFMKRAMVSLNPEVADVKPVPPSGFPK